MAEEMSLYRRRRRARSVIFHCCRIGVGIVFAWSSIPKIFDATSFISRLQDYAILPATITPLVASAVPWLEFIVALCILCNLMVADALLVCVVLFGLYAVAQIHAIGRGLKIECGCGVAHSGEVIGFFTIARTSGLLLLAALAFRLAKQREAL